MMKIQEQIFEWFNSANYQERQNIIECLEGIIANLKEELNNNYLECLEGFKDCDC